VDDFISWIAWPALFISMFSLGFIGEQLFSKSNIDLEDKSLRRSKKRATNFGFFMVFLTAVLLLTKHLLWAANSNAGAPAVDSLTMFSLIIGIIGVIITVLTGLSLTTAWRAIDQASEALSSTKGLLVEIDQKSSSANKISSEFKRLAAFVEASDRLRKVEGVLEEQLIAEYRAEIVSVFSRPDTNSTLGSIRDISSNKTMLLELGPLALEWLESVSQLNENRALRVSARTILDKINAAEVGV